MSAGADRASSRMTENIVRTVKASAALDLEDRPEFARFLEFIARSALVHPERLRNAAAVMDGDEDLFSGAEAEED